jgi:hypothetical protein
VADLSDPITILEEAAPEVNQLISVLKQLGEEGQSEQLAELYATIRARAVRVVTIGAFNQGKSTLINALIGAKVLPVALVPTTAVMTRVVSATPPGATLYYTDKRPPQEVSLEEVSEHLALDPGGKPRPRLRLVEVRCPWRDQAGNDLELYDTPGFNDLPEQAEAARQAVEEADLLLFMLNARQPLTEQEELIWQNWAAQSSAKPLFLLNFLNLLEEDDRELALERVRTGLRERLSLKEEPELLEINALLALRARLRNNPGELANSLLPGLVARLDYYSGPGRANLLRITRLGRLQKLLGALYNQNREQLEEAETRLRGWRERVAWQESARRQAERAAQIYNSLEDFKRQSLKEFEFKLLAELEKGVEQWSLDRMRFQVEDLSGQRVRTWLSFFEQESNRLIQPIKLAGPARTLKFVIPTIPEYNYSFSPADNPPPSVFNTNPLDAPLDFLGNAVRGLGQLVDELAGQRGPDLHQEQRERVIAHSRLATFVHEVSSRLEQQVSTVLTSNRPYYVSKTTQPEPPPPGLEHQSSLRRQMDEILTKLAIQLSR